MSNQMRQFLYERFVSGSPTQAFSWSYWTFGITSGLVQGHVDRADNAFNSPNDAANWLTFGIHGMIRCFGRSTSQHKSSEVCTRINFCRENDTT
ncbi:MULTISPECIES: hypothetical protein [Paenibacillus]|uniref:hypothetical protein n=1 Tax=Paenibacillus TaxID=44249 RepID=UPI0013D1CEA3|nr:hypothetical protein [Paenibacillus sp. ALJ109b]NEU62868.1 hypothetical protein [Paenibacillus sp. ALJ109b]